LDQALLATADKGVNHIMLVSQSYSYFKAASGMHMAIATFLAATRPTNSEGSHFDPLEALCKCLPLYGRLSHPVTEYGGQPSFTQVNLMWLELRRHSSGIYVVVSPNTRINIPQLLFYSNIYKLKFLLSVLWKKMPISYVFMHNTSFHWWTIIHLIFVCQLCHVSYF
jgi:hypothetical protein